MSTHTITKDLETDKYYLVNNQTGETQQINKTGEYIKKFHIELTGKANYKERVKGAKGNQAYMPYSTSVLQKFPEFYIPQQDKFDGYCQLPRTLQKPFVNNKNLRPHTTLEQTTRLLKGRLKNEQYQIPKPLKHITGSAKDLKSAESTGEIEVLQMRSETKKNNFMNDTVKIINNTILTKPNLQLYKEYKGKVKSSHSLYKPSTQNTITGENSQYKTAVIVPLEERKLSSIASYQKIGNEDQVERKSQFNTNTFQQIDQQPYREALMDQELFNVQYYDNKIQIHNKEIQAFHLPTQKIKQQISSKGRFNVDIANNERHYQSDRIMMTMFQPELFNSKESPKKKELEKERRKLAKMKEREMLERNLRRKI